MDSQFHNASSAKQNEPLPNATRTALSSDKIHEDIKFSILIPAFKAKFLEECISSILRQTYKNFELIIVNDASPKNLDEIVARFDDERIRYYVNEKNFGAVHVVGNWNKCLSYATGEWCICMGDDDRLLPCCLAEYRKLLYKYPNIELLHAWTEIIDENNSFKSYQIQRPEWESVYALINDKFFSTCSFIGDYCFKVAPLRQRGGFYDLPLAWASDDISAYQAAIKGGVANTPVPCFQYRSSSLTISSSKNARIKILALNKANVWYEEFLRNPAPNEIDEKYRQREYGILVPRLNSWNTGELIMDIDTHGLINLLKWIREYKQYEIPTKVFLCSLCKVVLSKTKRIIISVGHLIMK